MRTRLSSQIQYARKHANQLRREPCARCHQRHYLFYATQTRELVFFMRENGDISEANEAARREYGYAAGELEQLNLRDLHTQERRGAFPRRIVLPNPRGVTVETQQQRKDGSTFPVELSLSSEVIDGELVLLGIARDLSERRNWQALLRRWSDTFDHTAIGVLVTSSDGASVDMANPALAGLLGCDARELSGRPLLELAAPECRHQMAEQMAQAAETGALTFETRCQRLDGQSFPAQLTVTVARDPAGQALYRVVNVRDVSEQKHAEEQARRLTRVIEQADESVMITDLAGKIIYVNPSFEKISGYEAGEVLGQNPRILKSGYQHQVYYHNMWNTISSGETWRGMLTNRRKDGALFHEEASVFPIRDGDGEVVNYAAVKRDITDHIQHEVELEAISSLSAALRVAGTRDEMLPIILDQVLALFKGRGGMLTMVDQLPGNSLPGGRPAREIVIELTRGEFRNLNPRQLGVIKDRSLQVIHANQPYYNRNFGMEIAGGGDLAKYCLAIAGIPMVAQEHPVGVLWVGRLMEIGTNELRLMTSIANIAANAIYRATLHKRTAEYASELTQAYEATIEGWSRALELRDQETEGHTRRVADMTIHLARAVGISDDDLVHVRRGALLHDIGKMGIPDSVLLKPGPLTESEWEIMRRHPTYAYDLLSPISQLRPALDIPYYHHERWDGTGYPKGLRNHAIPLAARVFAVVDVWDALSSNRPYRKAWQRVQVRDFIENESGKHFDPEVVRAFLDYIPGQLFNHPN